MKQLVSLFALVTLCACATIMHGTSQDLGISSSPTGATVTIDNKVAGATPYIAQMARKHGHIVKLTMPGFAPAELTVTRSTSGWVWGNLVFGALIGLGVDALTGGLYSLNPSQLTATLASQKVSIAPTKDGIYIVLVKQADPNWIKIGQLAPLVLTTVGE